MKKQELRKIYKEKRSQLTFEEIKKLQKNIYQQIFDLDISKVKTVHLFLTLKKFKEIDTQPIIDYFRKSNKQIAVSICNFHDTTLSHFYLEENTALELNKFGVPEPIHAEPINETLIDLVFVPLLISDKKKFRVGYGKGFYDRFLSKCRKNTLKIGLNFFEPIPEIQDVNEFDIALDLLIVPNRIIEAS
jgi:5-formyltetrahydrofolate cyclo-ligase